MTKAKYNFVERLDEIEETKGTTNFDETWNEALNTLTKEDLKACLQHAASKHQVNNINKIILTQKQENFKLDARDWNEALEAILKDTPSSSENQIASVKVILELDKILSGGIITLETLETSLTKVIDEQKSSILINLLFDFNAAQSKENKNILLLKGLNKAVSSKTLENSKKEKIFMLLNLLPPNEIFASTLGAILPEAIKLEGIKNDIVELILYKSREQNSYGFTIFGFTFNKDYIPKENMLQALKVAYTTKNYYIFKQILKHPVSSNILKEELSDIFKRYDELDDELDYTNLKPIEEKEIRAKLQIDAIKYINIKNISSNKITVLKILTAPVIAFAAPIIFTWQNLTVGAVLFSDKAKAAVTSTKLWENIAGFADQKILSTNASKALSKFSSSFNILIEKNTDKLLNYFSLSSHTQDIAKNIVRSSAPVVLAVATLRAAVAFRNSEESANLTTRFFNACKAFCKTILDAGIIATVGTAGTLVAETAVAAGIIGTTAAGIIPLTTSLIVVGSANYFVNKYANKGNSFAANKAQGK
ncbi:MAG: hypothetical protein ACK4OM_01415 [Alphaproteobacteria bacterium]